MFKLVWSNQDSKSRLIKFIITSRYMKDNPKLQDEFIFEIDNAIKQNQSDITIVSKLKNLYLQDQNQNLLKRVENRISDLRRLIKKHKINRLLDLGSAEGSITSALATHYHLTKDQVFAVDIRSFPSNQDFTFIKLKDPYHLPFEDNYFDVVIALMTFHHLEKPELILTEINRILNKSGLLIIREHDQNEGFEFKILLDVVHCFYALIWSNEDLTNYFSNYRSKKEWDRLIKAAGFNYLRSTPSFGILKYYYGVYQKR